MGNEQYQDQDQETLNLMQENLRLTREIHTMTKKIRNYVIIQRVLSVLYFLLIVVPIILGIIYLPPLIRNLINPYQGLFNVSENVVNPNSINNPEEILDQAQKILKNNN